MFVQTEMQSKLNNIIEEFQFQTSNYQHIPKLLITNANSSALGKFDVVLKIVDFDHIYNHSTTE